MSNYLLILNKFFQLSDHLLLLLKHGLTASNLQFQDKRICELITLTS